MQPCFLEAVLIGRSFNLQVLLCFLFLSWAAILDSLWRQAFVFGRELLSKEWKDLFWDFAESWLHSENVDSDYTTAKDCLKKIAKYGKSLLTEPLASIFEFSLTLRSASPRLVLYRQLAEESLSSFPLADDVTSKALDEGILEPNETAKTRTSEAFLSGGNLDRPGNRCCWVDTGGSLFFEVTDLQTWLQTPNDVLVQLYVIHINFYVYEFLYIEKLLILQFRYHNTLFCCQIGWCISTAWDSWVWSCTSGFSCWKSQCHSLWSSWDWML